jgi:hypothetical protein
MVMGPGGSRKQEQLCRRRPEGLSPRLKFFHINQTLHNRVLKEGSYVINGSSYV